MTKRCIGLLFSLGLAAAACSSSASDEVEAAVADTTTTTAVESGDETVNSTTSSLPATATSSAPSTAEPAGVALPFTSADLISLPEQPVGVPFPTEEWPIGRLPDHVDRAAVNDLVRQGIAGEHGNIEAMLLIQGGELILEEYKPGYDPETVHDSFSVAKSVAHSLMGILAAEGRLDVTAPAAIEEWAGDERSAITPDMLARMSSGLDWDELSLLGITDPPDVISSLQTGEELVTEPNDVWVYSTGSTAVNGRIMGDIVGLGEDFDAWAIDVLFEPLGIADIELQHDGAGYWVAGTGANMSARDFARLGLLWMRDGVWDGDQILPSGWMDYARTPTNTYGAYGSGFWLGWQGPGSFSAEGLRGQNVMLTPDLDLVLVTVAAENAGDPIDQLAVRIIDEFRVR